VGACQKQIYLHNGGSLSCLGCQPGDVMGLLAVAQSDAQSQYTSVTFCADQLGGRQRRGGSAEPVQDPVGGSPCCGGVFAAAAGVQGDRRLCSRGGALPGAHHCVAPLFEAAQGGHGAEEAPARLLPGRLLFHLSWTSSQVSRTPNHCFLIVSRKKAPISSFSGHLLS
jgi:hypothetical protein